MNRKLFVVLMTMMALVLVTAVAYAITITIDGTREAAWDGGGTVSDPDEGLITNQGVDITRLQWTNDTTNFYFLIETLATTDWNRLPQRPYLWICINNDNSTLTGSTNPGICLTSGYDRYILVEGPTPLTVTVMDSTFAPIVATTNVATIGGFTELSVDLASLGFNAGNCLATVPTGIYFDGRTNDRDDNVEDGGDVSMGCGAPTAITLQTADANSQSPVIPFAIGVSLLVLFSAGLVYNRKRQAA